MTLSLSLSSLRSAAMAATPGPWEHGGTGSETVVFQRGGFPICEMWIRTNDRAEAKATSAFIAQANPATLLALLDALEAARGALDRIACWDEGPEVTPSFDEPYSAEVARSALAALPRAPHATEGEG